MIKTGSFDIANMPDVKWLQSEHIRPYVYMRRENLFSDPGSHLRGCDWFKNEPLYMNPLRMNESDFGDQILTLEAKAFHHSAMPMPRWVFYDCAIIPGFICGFAQKTSTLPKTFIEKVGVNSQLEWTPISLFIIIPTIRKGEWVAHNLCTANSLVTENDRLYALGFLTKAFGLWYANVEILVGMTQWHSPARKLHSHYGPFQVMTAYTPMHNYARTITYSCRLDFKYWPNFFAKDAHIHTSQYKETGILVDPKSDESLKDMQSRIEKGEGPYYLSHVDMRNLDLDQPVKVYRILA